MQIQSINSYNDKMNQPNFTAIKSLKMEGLYKKYPELGKQLVDTLQSSPRAMEFCKKYDVDIIFYACKRAMDAVDSSIHIFYDNIAKSRLMKIFGKSKDEVTISSRANEYDISKSLEKSTQDLQTRILPWSGENRQGGMLDSHLDGAERDMQEILNKKAKKAAEKQSKQLAKEQAKSKLDKDQQALNESIENLINNSNQ